MASSALMWSAATISALGFSESLTQSLEQTYMMNVLGWSVDDVANYKTLQGGLVIAVAAVGLPVMTTYLGDVRSAMVAGVSGTACYLMLLFASPDTPGLVYASAIFMALLHSGTVTMTALVSKLAPKHMRSTVMGVVWAIALVPKAVAPTLGGQVAESYNSAFWAALKLDMPGADSN